MSRYSSNEKSAFLFLICIIISGILPVAEPVFGSVPAGRTGRPLSASDIAALKKRKAKKALEAYNKRNAEIDSWIEDDAIPDHNNAALLYYQALLLQPDHDRTVINKFYDVYGGTEPDMQIRTFLGQWSPSLKVSEIASRIPQCNWGIWPEEKTSDFFLIKSFRDLSYIIAVDAITLASDGHYREALERCMTLRRIARHLSYDSKLHIASGACDGPALRTIPRILGAMPLNAYNLAWFQDQLAIFQEATPLLERDLQEYIKAEIDSIRLSSIAWLRGMLLKRAADEQARQNIRDLSDDQIRSQVFEAAQGFYGPIFEILHSDKSAEQKKTEIQEVTHHTTNKNISEPLMNIHNAFGEDAFRLIIGMYIQSTEEQKLAEIQRIIDKSAEPDTIELLTRFATAVGADVDFSFLVNRELTNNQRCAKMQKAIDGLNEAYAIKTSSFGLPWSAIDEPFESLVSRTAHVNIIKVAVKLYLIMAKTGRLPEELPGDLPKDPYTGLDFLYEITDNGFVLGCRSDVFKTGNIRFTFHVRKKSN